MCKHELLTNHSMAGGAARNAGLSFSTHTCKRVSSSTCSPRQLIEVILSTSHLSCSVKVRSAALPLLVALWESYSSSRWNWRRPQHALTYLHVASKALAPREIRIFAIPAALQAVEPAGGLSVITVCAGSSKRQQRPRLRSRVPFPLSYITNTSTGTGLSLSSPSPCSPKACFLSSYSARSA